MPDNSTDYRFILKGFTPETIPQARLGEYLTAIADLYGESASVHFVGLSESSLVVHSRVADEAEEETSERIESATDEEAPADAKKAYARLADMVRQDGGPAFIEHRGAVVLEWPTGERREEPAALVYGPFWQRGHLTGTVILIGGKTEQASVKLQVRDATITCKAKRSVAKELRDYLWGAPVRVDGNGQWIREADGAWKLLKFVISTFEAIDDESLTATVARLRAIDGKWKERTDPIAELDMLRSDDGEN